MCRVSGLEFESESLNPSRKNMDSTPTQVHCQTGVLHHWSKLWLSNEYWAPKQKRVQAALTSECKARFIASEPQVNH